MSARVMARWAATHGLVRFGLNQQARRGNLDARLMVDPALQADPFPYYEQLRAGPVAAVGQRGNFSLARATSA